MRIVFIILMLLANYNIFGQINVGPIELVKSRNKNFEPGDLANLRKSKTLFIYRDSDKKNLELFKSTLKKVWDYTQLEFISYKEFITNTYDENYSFFTISGLHKERTSSSGMVLKNTFIYLTLWMNKNDEKLTFCRIELYPNFPTLHRAGLYSKKDVNLMIKYLYQESILYNWNLIYLKNTLQFVNNRISKSENHWLFKNKVHNDLSFLKNDTLYIPYYTLIKFSAFNGDESKRHNVGKLFKKYRYPYKVVTKSELLEIALNSSKPIYYLSYIKSSTDKFVSVVNAKTGELLYSEYSAWSYNIKFKDLKKLSKAIKKLKLR